MTFIDNLKQRETLLLADRARIDEQLRDVRVALTGAEAIIAEAKEAAAEAQPTEAPAEAPAE